MSLKKRFFSDDSGASLLLVALMVPLLFTVVGITVDLGKVYAVQSKAQGALDVALMGAVSTASTTKVTTEAQRLFDANYPSKYMGSATSAFSVKQSGTVYNASVNVSVPASIMQMFGNKKTSLTIRSQVMSGQGNKDTIEIALVLDNSAKVDVKGLIKPTQIFINLLYSDAEKTKKTFLSLLPYNVAVRIGYEPDTRIKWAQDADEYKLHEWYFANRNPDIPPNATYADVTDKAPAAALTTRFRTPYGFGAGSFGNGDGVSKSLFYMLFGSNEPAKIIKYLYQMQPGGSTRTNVGLMWGWFTLSPNWTGRWDPGLPTLPFPATTLHAKVVILVSGSRNSVYLGGKQKCGKKTCTVSNDNTTTAQLCTAMKAAGIQIYTIGYGNESNYNASQLSTCSSGQGYYFTAKDGDQLMLSYQTIVDSMNYSSLRLSQ